MVLQRKIKQAASVLTCMLLMACSAVPPANRISCSQNAVSVSNPETKWEGELIVPREPEEKFHIRIQLEDSDPKVYFRTTDGSWIPVMPGFFKISWQGNNFLLYATDSGKNDDGVWIETWALIGTKISSDEIKAQWVRMVNNIDLPATSPNKSFSETANATFFKNNN